MNSTHSFDSQTGVAYGSQAMSETETRYVQIEKEAPAITCACEKFSTCILRKLSTETDLKPLASSTFGE